MAKGVDCKPFRFFAQLAGIGPVLWQIEDYIFKTPASSEARAELIAAELRDLVILKARNREPLIRLVLELYQMIQPAISRSLIIASVVKMIEFVEFRSEIGSTVMKESKRWNSLFARLKKLSEAIGINSKEEPKQESEKMQLIKKRARRTNSTLSHRI